MSNLTFNDIVKFRNSKEFIELDKYYKNVRTLDLFNYYGQENPHTNFLANLFKIDNPYTNNDKPFKLFLGLLSIAHEFDGNKKLSKERAVEYKELIDIYLNYKEISQIKISPQTKFGDSKYQPDITIEFNVENQKHIILVECKISAKENDKKPYNSKEYKQTELYRAISENNYDKKGYKVYYIFLSVSNETEIFDYENWVKISYQNLVDYVLYPCSIESSDINIPFTIEEYINSYSNSYFKKNTGVLKLAITPKEKELVKTMWKEHQKIIKIILNILIDKSKSRTDEEKIVERFYADKAMILFSIYYILNYEEEKHVSDEEMAELEKKKPIYRFDDKPYYTMIDFICAVLQDILNSANTKINSFDDIPANIIGKQYKCPRLALTEEEIDDRNKKFFDSNRINKYPLTIFKSNQALWYATSYDIDDLKNFIDDIKNEYEEYKDRIKLSL